MNLLLLRWLPSLRSSGDEGMSSAEYAVGTIAAVAFAGTLYAVITGQSITDLLTQVITNAISTEL